MFYEIRFPPRISYGSAGGPTWYTALATMKGGAEQANEDWSIQRCQFDVIHGLKTQADMNILLAFFNGLAKGRANRFRYKDWLDYTFTDETIGTGTGSPQTCQLIKTYSVGAGAATYARALTKPVWHTALEADGTPLADSVTVKFNGVAQTYGVTWTLDATTGIITCTAPVAEVITASGQYDVPCRFDIDALKATIDAYDRHTWSQIPIIEVRV
jgi:uncharacterized protein (TIGR02217 family)